MRHKIYLDTRMKRKSGEYPLRVALTYEGRRMYVATGICVAPCHWDPRSERVTGHPHQHQFNTMLGKIRMDVDGLCLSLMGQDLPFDEVKRRLSCTVSGEDWTRLDKPKLMEQYLRFAQAQRNERTRKQYLFTMERIRRFDAACDELLLEDITAEWLMLHTKTLCWMRPICVAELRTGLLRSTGNATCSPTSSAFRLGAIGNFSVVSLLIFEYLFVTLLAKVSTMNKLCKHFAN